MRTLHVVDSVCPEAGSVGVVLPGLIQALTERRIESQSIAASDPAAGQAIRAADLVHLHGWGSSGLRTAAATACGAGIPYIISPLGGMGDNPHRRRSWRDRLRAWMGENRLIRSAAAVCGANESETQALRDGRLNANVWVLPYGIGFAAYESANSMPVELPQAPTGRCLLALGPIHPVEGLVPLLKAVAELGAEADAWTVVFAGPESGDWRRMLQAAVHRKGGGGRVVFTPASDLATQRAWLGRASVLAAPSLHFRCSVSVLQAVAAGVAVVASDRVALDGLGEGVRVCPPVRGALAEALRSVLGLSDEARATMAGRARAAAIARFDWSVLSELYTSTYQRIVG